MPHVVTFQTAETFHVSTSKRATGTGLWFLIWPSQQSHQLLHTALMTSAVSLLPHKHPVVLSADTRTNKPHLFSILENKAKKKKVPKV